MEEWKHNELRAFVKTHKEAARVHIGAFLSLQERAMRVLAKLPNLHECTFEEKLRRLDEFTRDSGLPSGEDGDSVERLAIDSAAVKLHARYSEVSWFEMSTDCLLREGAIYERATGLEAFLWSHDLGLDFTLWFHGAVGRWDEWDTRVVPLLRWNKIAETFPFLDVAASIPALYWVLSGFFQTDNMMAKWDGKYGAQFTGHLLYLRVLAAGIRRLGKVDDLAKHLPVVNGAILSWPCPKEAGGALMRFMVESLGAECGMPATQPGYYESGLWCETLWRHAGNFVEAFDASFCGIEPSGWPPKGAWKQLGAALHVLNQPASTYGLNPLGDAKGN